MPRRSTNTSTSSSHLALPPPPMSGSPRDAPIASHPEAPVLSEPATIGITNDAHENAQNVNISNTKKTLQFWLVFRTFWPTMHEGDMSADPLAISFCSGYLHHYVPQCARLDVRRDGTTDHCSRPQRCQLRMGRQRICSCQCGLDAHCRRAK